MQLRDLPRRTLCSPPETILFPAVLPISPVPKLTHRARRLRCCALLLAHVAVARKAGVAEGAQGLPVPGVAPAGEDQVVGALRHEKGRAGDDVGAAASAAAAAAESSKRLRGLVVLLEERAIAKVVIRFFFFSF